MPAKAGIQNYLKTQDSRLRGNDAKGRFKTFYETLNARFAKFESWFCFRLVPQREYRMCRALLPLSVKSLNFLDIFRIQFKIPRTGEHNFHIAA